jgi:hypothetical protein
MHDMSFSKKQFLTTDTTLYQNTFIMIFQLSISYIFIREPY